MLYVLILYPSDGTYSFKVIIEQQIFFKTFHGNFIGSQSFFFKSADKKSPKEYFLFFVSMSDLELESWLCV